MKTCRIKKRSLGFGNVDWITFEFGDCSQTPLGTFNTKAAAAGWARTAKVQVVSKEGIKLFWCNSLDNFVTIPED